MLKERTFGIGNFIRLTSAGMEVAEFVDVRDRLIQRYKEVYGSDIDLSTASADGVFVNDLALIINNILQVMRQLYSNLDVETASGIYLDALCRLANVRRQLATKSTASIEITNLSSDTATFDDGGTANPQNRITCIDNAGNEWVSNTAITLAGNATAELKVTCTEAGPIDAPAGWINQTMIAMNCSISQPEDCVRGTNDETDTELRNRRAQSSGANGVGVLESLVGAMLEVTGIEDVRIINNNGLVNVDSADGTTVLPHDIYVIVRSRLGIDISDETIGNLIYNKLTPGIRTTESKCMSANGIHKSYEYIPQMLAVAITNFNQNVYWKQAVPIAPAITIKLTPNAYFTENGLDTIAEAVYEYANNLKLGETVNTDRIFIETLDADPMFKGQRTYSLNSNDVSIVSTTNPDTYYNYTKKTASFANNVWTLVIS